ncbi:MAG: 50S ribosomal protein L9 [Bacteroidales bacterium]|jgi:large subunit ribosomal protein L9|nr:50S ribosomal protein L9 [Bacteroidales bacterium]
MEIILKQDVNNLGSKDDIIVVKDGYARNFLIPKGLAMMASVSAKKVLAENIRQRAHKEAKIKAEAEKVAARMTGLKLTIGAKTSSTGKIFGSVNTIQIAEALQEKGFEIDRKNVRMQEDQIKEVGAYKAKIKLHKELYVEVDFDVVSE